jgi:hypothetical protein
MNKVEKAKGGSAIRRTGEHAVTRDDARCSFERALVHFNVANKLTGSSLGAEKRRIRCCAPTRERWEANSIDADQGKLKNLSGHSPEINLELIYSSVLVVC